MKFQAKSPWPALAISAALIVPAAAFGQAADVDCNRCIDTSDVAPFAVTSGKIASGAVTVDKVSAELANAIDTSCTAGQVVVGLDANGDLVCEAPAPADPGRFEYVAGPGQGGVVVQIPGDEIDAYCGDGDGCVIDIWMINYDGLGVGTVRSSTLWTKVEGDFRWLHSWQDAVGDGVGSDDNNVVQEFVYNDCFVGDFDSGSGANNRTDSNRNWGLLNCQGCGFSDVTTTCKVVVKD